MTSGPAPAGRPHPTVAAVRDLLRRRGFRSLFAARAISQFGDGLFQFAAADLLLFDDPGANPAATLLRISIVTLIPFSIVGPFVGVFIDRWDRRRILALTPIFRAALIVLVPFTSSGSADNLAFYLVVLTVLSANRFFLATMSAVTPQVVPAEELLVANSVATTGGSIANVVGLGIGATLAGWFGGTRAGVISSVAFVAAAIVARRIPVRAATAATREALGSALGRVAVQMVDGIRRVRESRLASYALGAIATMQVLIGAMIASVVVVYIVRLGLGVGAAGGLLAATAVGIFAGVAAVPVVARHIPEERLPPLGFAIGGVSTLLASTSLTRPSLLFGSLFAGFAFAFAKIPVDTMVQEALPDEFRGRAFASYDVLYNMARVVGTAGAAWAVAANASEEAIVTGIGIAYLLAGAVALALSARAVGAPRVITAMPEDTPSAIAVAAARLRRKRSPPAPGTPATPSAAPEGDAPFAVGELVDVRAYAGYRADEEPRAIVAGGREFPIEEIIWRAVEERSGERRRIFVLRAAGRQIRLAYNEASSRWEIDRTVRMEPGSPPGE